MADLFERLFPADPDADSIAGHYFYAAMVDYAAGHTTRQQIADWWSLDAGARADLDALCDKVDALAGKMDRLAFGEELHAVLMFAEAGAKYTTKAAFRARLGL